MRLPRRRRPAGFTLLELLVAMLIAGLIVGVVYTLYHTVTLAVSGRRVRDDQVARVGCAFQSVCADLSSLFPGPSDDGLIRLGFAEAGQTNFSDLVFCAVRAPGSEPDMRWAQAVQVRYRVDTPSAGGGELLCETRALAGPGAEAVETNRLLAGVAGFRVSLFDGETWKAEWGGTAERIAPRAARIELETDGGKELVRTEVSIAAGLVVSGRLERAAAGP
ncbi:MAG TPA: prepilin-type N-terminal cleavage/methylation domain-containing protein [Kiritimatiellia bacterium]|nr:prepilin-type N-terminal cleavage/methylation domain-containing protein [Kiritimatiellia bacterium]HRZ12177.1 prepilin-type N-terminal cleavage/methylation domain-containing protein [Kiritimatiellia bacterium]HSA18065.1 prepilin-type N-terminal cleavage/methylation domain-containing protein [Kiritimatiellia bacterium]